MRDRPNSRNAELEAFDRALRGETETEVTDPTSPEDGVVTRGDSAPGGPPPPTGDDGTGPEEAVATAPYGEAEGEDGVTTEVLARDLIIFQVKLLLDGLKDLVLSPLSIAAVAWDLIPSRRGYRGRTFYKVMKIGERFDLWLNLYTHARSARLENQGLLEAGVHSADSLMGKLEQLARAEAERQARKHKRVDDGGWGG